MTISSRDFAAILAPTAADLRQHVDELRDLDAALGDGDLGVTVELGCKAMSVYLEANTETDIGRMLIQLGMHINRANPSTFGTLLASAFMGAGRAVQFNSQLANSQLAKSELTADDLLRMGDGAIDAIKKRGKAEAGDKTMLDSLVPAVEESRKALESGSTFLEALGSATRASEAGLNATATMKAKFGRASWRPDRGVGLKDGGAAAMHILVHRFTENLRRVLLDQPNRDSGP